MPEESVTISTKEAAEILEVTSATIIRMWHRKELTGYSLTEAKGSPIRIYKDSITHALELRHEATDRPPVSPASKPD